MMLWMRGSDGLVMELLSHAASSRSYLTVVLQGSHWLESSAPKFRRSARPP